MVSHTTTIEQSDRHELLQAAIEGRKPDPEVSKRVEERANQAREAMRRRGVVDVAVNLIREGRDR